ncbi:MAG: hypothetical protein HDT04_01820 [Bacteroidales bacterium]|nr:hypothetical protein [Bacteroidales bacterium]
MNTDVLSQVALRNNAVYIPMAEVNPKEDMTPESTAFVALLGQLGYQVSEGLLHALNGCSEQRLEKIADNIRAAYNVGLNWSALVKGWRTPTGETVADHLITLFQNLGMVDLPSVTLPCGHQIPEGTFPLERYTGCPFCGRPLITTNYTYTGQGTPKKVLELWSQPELVALLRSLLESKVPLNATAIENLKALMMAFPVPADVEIPVKENRILVADILWQRGDFEEALRFLKTPTDLLRMVWYQRTGSLRIVPPKVYKQLHEAVNRDGAFHKNPRGGVEPVIGNLALKFSRAQAKVVARWLNGLAASAESLCEDMHKHRGMWVRMIRALRLAEYSHKPGMDKLSQLLDLFYRGDYRVWQGSVNRALEAGDASAAFALLAERPGIFARSLFALIGKFGLRQVMKAFEPVLPSVAPRILLSMSALAEEYFFAVNNSRSVGAPGLKKVLADLPKGVCDMSDNERADAILAINELYVKAMEVRFAAQQKTDAPIYIDPELDDIPVPVGDRSTIVSDLPPAYQGQRFRVEGDDVRLFLQWGQGLPAQHLDMDLSAKLVKENSYTRDCAYYDLSFNGARHSGDIREIPDQVGTAEYVELNIPTLLKEGWKYAVFTCNAYSSTTLDPRLVVGWMTCQHPMAVSDTTGVAYDPSTVQHMVRISTTNLMRGLVFGFLDLQARIIYWVEMPLTSRIAAQLKSQQIEAYIRRLKARPTIGQMLRNRAAIQQTPLTDNPADAATVYDTRWAYNPAAVADVLL